jgi:hypothetical protein
MQSAYQSYLSQNAVKERPMFVSHEVQNQVAIPNQKYLNRRQISPLLPQEVVETLNLKEEFLSKYSKVIEKNKQMLDKDMDNFLKEIILMFEEFKQQLFSKMDNHSESFAKIYEQYEKVAYDCSDWAEQKIASANIQNDMKASVHDLLSQGLFQARYQKQRADEVEKSLLAIKQKIDSSKLNELNAEIRSLSEERNQRPYVPEEAQEFYDSLKVGLKAKIGQLNQSRIVPPFSINQVSNNQNNNMIFYDQNFTDPQKTDVPNFQNGTKTNLSGILNQVFNKDGDKQGIAPKSNVVANSNPVYSNQYSSQNIDEQVKQNEPNKCGIIAQQNQFYSDEFSFANPSIKQEKEINFAVKSRVNSVLSLTSSTALFGTDDGSVIILNIPKESQTLFKAHSSPIIGLTKANESLVLTSAAKPDQSIKLWDFSPLINLPLVQDPSKPKGNVLLLRTLSGLNDTAIGHGFLNDHNIIAIGRDGQILIWDWSLGQCVAESKVGYTNLNSMIIFSNKESFAVSNDEGFVAAFSVLKESNQFTISKTCEFKESMPVVGLHTFRGNNDIIITVLATGEVKLIDKNTKLNHQTIVGCKSPISFFVLTSIGRNSTIYLMSLETFGFKLADIEGQDFVFVNTQATTNFKFEKLGWPSWQIIDCVSKEKLTFITINSGKEPNGAILWNLNSSK